MTWVTSGGAMVVVDVVGGGVPDVSLSFALIRQENPVAESR